MAAEKEQVDTDYDYYDETFDDEDESSRGPIRMVVVFIVVAAFCGVGWIAYKQGVREGSSKIPVLKAETTAMKETPSQPGGAQANYGNREIYERPGESSGQPEQLLPPPEQPIEPSATKTPVASAPPAVQPPPAAAPQAAPPASATPVITEPEEPVTAPAATAPPPPVAAVSPAASAPAASAIAEGAFLVQIAAARSADEANGLWTKLQTKNNDLLSAYQSDIVAVDLGAKGTYHRLRFGPFSSRDDAANTCNALKARKQDCIVVKK